MPLDPVMANAVSVLLCGVLLHAGVHKLRAPLRFAAIIDNYRLLPAGAGRWLVRPLGGVEALLGAALLLPAARGIAAPLVALLLLAYAAAMGINLARGRRHIDCGCGGAGERQPIGAGLVARNLLLAAFVLVPLLAAPAARALGWIDWFTVLCAALAGGAVYGGANRLLANHRLLAGLR